MYAGRGGGGEKRPRFPEPLKETNTDTPFMHNVYDRIGAMAAFAAIRRAVWRHQKRDALNEAQ
jgi:hypothetical protein